MRTMTAAGRARLLAAALVLGWTGCAPASQETSGAEEPSPPDRMLYDGCRTDQPALRNATKVAHADLDGDGRPSEVTHVPATSGGCADALVTMLGGRLAAMPVPGLTSVAVVDLRGSGRDLLLVRGRGHPRGGYQQLLVGGARQRLGEIRAGGRPLVGFVATDGGAAPATVTCTPDGGVATVTATTHAPPGVVLAWDVRRTTYTLEGNRAVRTSSTLDEAVIDPRLERRLPQLFDPEGAFADCLRR
jgi:hypothetical protein